MTRFVSIPRESRRKYGVLTNFNVWLCAFVWDWQFFLESTARR